MRPGPTDLEMSGALTVGVEVNILHGNMVLATSVPVKNVKLEWASDRVVAAQLTYTAPEEMAPKRPNDPLNFYGQRSEVHVLYAFPDGRRHRVALGQFLHTSWKEEGGGVKVTALDLMQVLEDDPMPWPSSPPAGATVETELQRLAGPIPVVLDEGVTNSWVPRTAQWGTSRTEAALGLAQSLGFGLRMGADACLHAYPIRGGGIVDILFTREEGTLLEVIHERVEERKPNRWVAVGTVDDTQVTRTATHDEFPFSPLFYGRKTARIEVSSAKSAGDVQKALDDAMRDDLGALTSASFDVMPDARVEVGDIVSAVDWDGSTVTGRVRAYSLPITDVGERMRIDIDILEW